MNRLSASAIALAALLPACSLPGPDEVSDVIDGVTDDVTDDLPPVDGDAIAEQIEARLMDALVCSEKIRPSTLERLRAVLRDPSQQTLADLVTSPEVIADVVAMAGTRVEDSVILLNNLALLYEQGHAGIVLEQGWDTLSCDDEVTLACTAGSGTTAVRCGAGPTPDAVELSFDACILRGTKYEGRARFSRLEGDARIGVVFDALVFDEVDRLDGALVLEVGPVDGTQSLAKDTGAALALVSHGGPAGASCGEALSFETFRAEHTPSSASLALDAVRETAESSYALRTLGEHLRFDVPRACACPSPGAGLEVVFPRPLSDAGETATLRATWGPAVSDDECASVDVTIVDWPEACPLLDQAQPGCGQEAARRAVASLLGAFCTPLDG